MEDRELVRKILEGDASAQELLVKLHREPLRRTCVHILGYGDSDLEDILQDTFAAAFQKLSGFEFRSSLGHWLRQICVHLCYRRWRKRKRMAVLAQEDMEMLMVPDALSLQDAGRLEAEKARRMAALEKGKEGLGKPCRDLLTLRDEGAKSYVEIGEILRVPMGTVMSRLARCRETLKDLVRRVISGEKDE